MVLLHRLAKTGARTTREQQDKGLTGSLFRNPQIWVFRPAEHLFSTCSSQLRACWQRQYRSYLAVSGYRPRLSLKAAAMRQRFAITMLVLLLVSGSASAHVRTKKRHHKSRAVASSHMAEPILRTPPEPAAQPIAPLPVLLVILAGVVATAFVSFVGALSRARGIESESEVPAHATVRSRSVASVGVAAAQRIRLNANQFGKTGLASLP